MVHDDGSRTIPDETPVPRLALIVTPDERDAHEQRGSEITIQANALVVTDGTSFAAAVAWLRDVVAPIKRQIADQFRPRIDQAHQLHRGLIADERKFLGPVEAAEQIVRERIIAYEREQERRRREAIERQRREQERLEAAERERVRVVQENLRRVVEEARLAEALAAEQAGDTERAERLIDAPIVPPAVTPRPVFAPPSVVVDTPKAEGISFRDEYDFTIENLAAIPRDYLMPDEKKIRAVVRALKDATNIPGIKVVPRRVSTVRTK